MSAPAETSVVVVGAGPVGLAMAVGLARQGVRCRILDRGSGPVTESRAIAIQARTLEIFDAMGIVDPILAAGHRIHGANIFAEGERILHFRFDELPSPYPFTLDLAQSHTERLLAGHMQNYGIAVEYQTEITGLDQDESRVVLHTAAGAKIEGHYAVGCDGAHSTVRHLLGLAFEGAADDETFVLADVSLDWDRPEDEWNLWFHEDGLLTLFPLGGGKFRVIAETAHDEPADFDHVKAVFEQRGPKGARISDPAWISQFRISHRKVQDYQRGRVFLAGDAAHVHSPAGGQGMNTGIQDAHNLAWKLAMVLRGNAPAALLESYTAEREPVARSVLALTENMTTIATLRSSLPQKIRNRLLPILAGFEIVQHRMLGRLAELDIQYRRSPIIGQHGRWHTTGPAAGGRAIDAPLDGGRRLFDLLRTEQHVVLLFAGEHPQPSDMRGFANLDRYMRDGYPDEVVTYLVSRNQSPWDGRQVVDEHGKAHEIYAPAGPCVYLIRPDGYVGFRSLSADPLPLFEHLTRVYEPPLENEA